MVFRKRDLSVSYILYGIKNGIIKFDNGDSDRDTKSSDLVELILSNGSITLFGEDVDGVIRFTKDSYKVRILLNFVGDLIPLKGIFREELKDLKYTTLSPIDYNNFMNFNITILTPEGIPTERFGEIGEKYFKIN